MGSILNSAQMGKAELLKSSRRATFAIRVAGIDPAHWVFIWSMSWCPLKVAICIHLAQYRVETWIRASWLLLLSSLQPLLQGILACLTLESIQCIEFFSESCHGAGRRHSFAHIFHNIESRSESEQVDFSFFAISIGKYCTVGIVKVDYLKALYKYFCQLFVSTISDGACWNFI